VIIKVINSTNIGGLGQFGNTTYIKVFVKDLARGTQKKTMEKYFEQFGEILEVVVIINKNIRRSKGYSFVSDHHYFSSLCYLEQVLDVVMKFIKTFNQPYFLVYIF
jgi:hypothetical protein